MTRKTKRTSKRSSVTKKTSKRSKTKFVRPKNKVSKKIGRMNGLEDCKICSNWINTLSQFNNLKLAEHPVRVCDNCVRYHKDRKRLGVGKATEIDQNLELFNRYLLQAMVNRANIQTVELKKLQNINKIRKQLDPKAIPMGPSEFLEEYKKQQILQQLNKIKVPK